MILINASPNDIQNIVIKKDLSIINIFNQGNTVYYHDFIFEWDINHQVWIDTEFSDWTIKITKNDFQIGIYEYHKDNIISYDEFFFTIKKKIKIRLDSDLLDYDNPDDIQVKNNKCCLFF